MSAYELDDAMVRECLLQSRSMPPYLINQLTDQLPIPVPVGLGAVVETESNAVFVRTAATDVQFCWWDVTKHVGWFSDAQLGKVTKVLSEGVDL